MPRDAVAHTSVGRRNRRTRYHTLVAISCEPHRATSAVLLSKAVQTRASRSAPETAAYNVRVHAFEGTPQQTLRGLRDLFGLDVARAQRLMASVPAVLRHRISAAEAEHWAQALRSIGARVVLEDAAAPSPPAPPMPPRPPTPPWQTTQAGARLRQPATGAASVGQPIAHQSSAVAQDLEYDVLSALDAVLDQPERDAASDPLRDLGRELELEAPRMHAPQPTTEAAEFALEEHRPAQPSRQAAKKAQRELSEDTLSIHRAPALELDAAAVRRPLDPGHSRAPQPALGEPHGQLPAQTDPFANGRTQPGPRPHSPVALRVQPQAVEDSSRAVPLLQLGGLVAVVALGLWLDSSVIYGNAGTVSVILHGLALQQGLLGLRGMFR
jgi:ribosomal protein L7/L12